MKKLTLSLMMLFFAFSGFAQKVVEPDYIGQVAVMNSDSTLTVLPKEAAEQKTSSSKWGMIPIPGSGLLDKATAYMAVKGTNSPTKFPSGKTILVIRGKDNNEEPKNAFGIFKFEKKKKERRYSLAEAGVYSGSKMTTSFNTVPFNAKKYGETSYIVELTNLEAGEYGIVTTGLSEVTTFSVQ